MALTATSPARRRCKSLRRLIGDTPLFALACRVRGEERTVYAKHETLNFTGSCRPADSFGRSSSRL